MTTLKTVQEEKTINKTSAETTAIPNQSMKGGEAMTQEDSTTQEDCMKSAIISSNYNIRKHICNYNKKYHQHMELDPLKDFLEYLKGRKNFEKIKEAYQIVGMIEQQRFDELIKEYNLNLQYGNYYVHPSELQKKEVSNMEQQSIAMRATAKQATARTNKIINRAIREQEQLEEQLEIIDNLLENYNK